MYRYHTGQADRVVNLKSKQMFSGAARALSVHETFGSFVEAQRDAPEGAIVAVLLHIDRLAPRCRVTLQNQHVICLLRRFCSAKHRRERKRRSFRLLSRMHY